MIRKQVTWYRRWQPERFPSRELIRLGSESCHQLMPGVRVINELSSLHDPDRLILVTPLAGPDDLEEIVSSALAALGQGWREVVVNDWGVLREMGRRPGSGVTAGRLLLRLRRGPGRRDVRPEADAATRRYFAWGPLYNSQFLDLLRERNVTRLEVDPPRQWEALPHLPGFSVSLHRDHRLISVAATCPFEQSGERDYAYSTGSCRAGCLTAGLVTMRSELLERPLVQFGREIMEMCADDPPPEDLPTWVDRIITTEFGTESAGNSRIV